MTTAINFGYGSLLPSVADELRAITGRIRSLLAETPTDRQAIDRDLAAAKEKLLPSEFGKWLMAEFGTDDVAALQPAATGADDPAQAVSTQADCLEACALRIEMGARTTIQGILIAGQALAEARLIHGENDKAYGQWRKRRLPWLSDDTAKRFLAVWKQYGERLLAHNAPVDFLANFAPTVLYALAAPSTPDSVREQIESRAAGGEHVTVAEVERLKREAREDAAAKAAAEIAVERKRLEAEKHGALEAANLARDKAVAERGRLADEVERLKAATEEARQAGVRETHRVVQQQLEQARAEANTARAAAAKAEAAARSARVEAEAAAHARAEALAEEALAARKRDLADLERKAKAAAQAAERERLVEKDLRETVERHQAYLARTREADHEAPYQIEAATALADALFKSMTALSGFEFPPTPDVARHWEATGQMCRQMADAIDRHLAPRLVAAAQ